MTTIDLIINLGQDVLESVTTLFKLVAFKLCTVYISVSFIFVVVLFVSVADINNAPYTIAQM